jgi:two-component system, NtrC family, nitrogen regulation response regulator NtrX
VLQKGDQQLEMSQLADDPMNKARILVVDDDALFRELVQDVLQVEEYAVFVAGNGYEALERIKVDTPDLLLLDVSMPDFSGLQVLAQVNKERPDLTVVMISGQSTIKDAVEAIKLGAYDFIEKPVDAQRILLTVHNTLEVAQARKTVNATTEQNLARYGMIGASVAMQRVFGVIDTLAPTDATVLITGENGTGKELVARALHRLSKRNAGPFIQVNCAAIPDSLLESELFGYEKGAFTDARANKKGRFQLAQNGTLFLDEIGDLSLQAQAKILLALEQDEVMPLGAEKAGQVDIRFLFATNKNIEEMVTTGCFRQDLYYRINVIPIHLQPLRQRSDDIVPLAEHFLQHFHSSYPGDAKKLTRDATAFLTSLPWAGNIRELRNVMEKTCILLESQLITRQVLKNIFHYQDNDLDLLSGTRETLKIARDAFEKDYIQSVLAEQHGNIQQTAELLGINRSHLYRKMMQLGIKQTEN